MTHMGKTGGGVGSNQYGPKGRSVAKTAQRPAANLMGQATAKPAKATKPARWTCPPLNDGPLILPPRRLSPYARPIRNSQMAKEHADREMVRRYVRYGLGDTPAGMPGLAQDAGRATMRHIAQRLADAGMPRTSKLAGGEIAGLIENNHIGSTGFSVAVHEDKVRFHVVLSGRAAGLAYQPSTNWHHDDDDDDDRELEEPINPDRLLPQVTQVFKDAGLHVQSAKCAGWQTYWDDDVDYEVLCDRW